MAVGYHRHLLDTLRTRWALVPVLALAAAYLPHPGRAFLKDDFAWLLGSRVDGLAGVYMSARCTGGDHEPVVHA